MPFIKVPGLPGRLYVPEAPLDAPKKHPCADCFSCQMCSDARCAVCREKGPGCCKTRTKKEKTIEKPD